MQRSLDALSPTRTSRAIDQQNVAYLTVLVFIVLAWVAVAAQLLWLDWERTAQALGDSDDAMRLVQVRELLAGRGWFDLHEPRLQPPFGHDTHWSRLIDAGLAGLFLLLNWFTDAAHAERLMRAVWPLLWLLPAMAGTVALAWRLGGRVAAFVVLLLLLFGLPAYMQFRPGRIDHHDVQITLAILTLAAAIWSDKARRTAWAAGGLSGLALAIGLEGMAFIGLAAALLMLRYVINADFAPALARFGSALAAASAILFLLTVSPERWTRTACDGMAINWIVPAVSGGLALWAAGAWFAETGRAVRAATIFGSVGIAIAIFVGLEPRCLGGPLATVDPAVKAIWLGHVSEAQSLFALAEKSPLSALGIAAYPAAAIIAAAVLAQDKVMRRESGFLALAAALVVATAMTIIAIRASPYTIWLGMPMMAVAVLRLCDRWGVRSLPGKVPVTLAFSPVLLSAGVIALAETVLAAPSEKDAVADRACLQTESYRPLSRLPAGLVAADVDYGPFLLALTPHSALGAPYHRMEYGILTSHRVFASPPDAAREILRDTASRYLMTCGSRGPKGLSQSEMAQSLWARLMSGDVPEWLEPISGTSPFRVYRIRP